MKLDYYFRKYKDLFIYSQALLSSYYYLEVSITIMLIFSDVYLEFSRSIGHNNNVVIVQLYL